MTENEQGVAAEARIVVLEHRVLTLEQEPPRVRVLEQEVGILKSAMDKVGDDVRATRQDIKHINDRINDTATAKEVKEVADKTAKEVRGVADKVTNIMALGTAILGVSGMIVATLQVAKTLGWL